LDEAGRTRLLNAFKSLTLATYASRFDGYSGQRFETIEEREGLRNDILVRTELVDTDGDTVALDYLVRQQDGEWMVIDVFFKRISEMATRKSEYTSVIRRNGIDGLIQLLEAKVQEIEAEEAPS
jgi:phospholipid transport system substrate-binding protein